MKEAILPYAYFHYAAPVVFIEFQRDIELGFLEVREVFVVCEKLSDGLPYVVLADVRKGVGLTPMGKKASTGTPASPLHRGTAVVMLHETMREAIDFLRKMNRAPYPFRAFTERQQAIDWLLTLPLL